MRCRCYARRYATVMRHATTLMSPLLTGTCYIADALYATISLIFFYAIFRYAMPRYIEMLPRYDMHMMLLFTQFACRYARFA